jgi:hypothetical protein
MATVTSRTTLKEYCLRRLGAPVIEVNVAESQVDDAVDYTLEKFAQFGYDGVTRMYLKHEVTQEEVDRALSSGSSVTAADGTVFKEGAGYLNLPDSVVGVNGVFDFGDKNAMSFFDIRYQIRLNDLYDFTSTQFTHYYLIMQQLSQIDFLLVGKKPVRFAQTQSRLYIDMDWRNDIAAGKFLIIDAYKAINPQEFTKVYNNLWVKDYCTALIKRYWGQNMIKYDGVQLPGGVTLNGTKIYDDAVNELEKLDKELRDQYELPPLDMIG